MRLFMSYARVDKYYCLQIVDMLDIHDVWYDNRLHAGQQWWDQIRRRLEWCDGFVYLLSPDSVQSKYCRKEFEIAQSLGKPVFPVLIQARTPIPADLEHIQYVDFSEGMTAHTVKLLLNSLAVAEREDNLVRAAAGVGGGGISQDMGSPETEAEFEALMTEAAASFDAEDYDRAAFLLKQAIDSDFQPEFIDLEAMLREAEKAVEWEAYRREAEREYSTIAALVKHKRTRKIGAQAFRAYYRSFPDYDPENLAAICLPNSMSLLEWCSVPSGEVKIKRGGKVKVYQVGEFDIGKYPVTNAQIVEFFDAPDGYANLNWWDYSAHALLWRRDHPRAAYPKPVGHDHPCVYTSWYEAVAYCRWMSYKSGLRIALPNEQQWLRAAQGDDNRLYPWGNSFDPARCNTKESGLQLTVPVTAHPAGASAYGPLDMAGNVWEWCVNNADSGVGSAIIVDENRVIKGGSFNVNSKNVHNHVHHALNPECRYDSVGFRLVRLRD
jgi:formylglycine-generating enzyme required for sulfatase activity